MKATVKHLNYTASQKNVGILSGKKKQVYIFTTKTYQSLVLLSSYKLFSQ